MLVSRYYASRHSHTTVHSALASIPGRSQLRKTVRGAGIEANSTPMCMSKLDCIPHADIIIRQRRGVYRVLYFTGIQASIKSQLIYKNKQDTR